MPTIFWATDVANDLITNAGGAHSALISDEIWSLFGANSNPLAAGYIQEMVKTIRGLGGIAITSTQGMQDLFSLDNGKYGKGILDSSRIKVIMQMEEQEARLIQNVLNLSEEEVRQITRFRRGEGLLCIIAQGRRNGYAYGRGEKYSLELGNDLSRALSSEFAMPASPQTAPLFLKKYQQKQLKQHRRREPVHKRSCSTGFYRLRKQSSHSDAFQPRIYNQRYAPKVLAPGKR